ncbi:MAG: phosphate transport system substrate-binding protein, partial [Frankiales bacterium]|nr:phosphate transport system substrate-binding protein [Frankiales bacterium]
MKRLLRTLIAVAFAGGLTATTPAHADNYVSITGAGSTWSQVAIDAWRADIRANGVVVNYSGTGSTDGRTQYIQHTVDFAVTEIPFENPPEPGQPAEVPDRPYAYLPIVAGGTSFMYHLTLAGKQVRDLRLSGTTLSLIFTGGITRWNDQRITADNQGRVLPDEAIIPVLRSDGAGASAQFSRYMTRMYPAIWCPFAQKHLGACGLTSFFPTFGNAKSQVGSNGVADYVSASYGEGAIGYVEYAYAKRLDYPVASLLNQAGFYTQPSASDVAIALTRAQINADLTQNLDAVYVNPDPRTYPMSSYSYMVVPTTTAAPMNADKGKSLSTFINYFLCAGQQKAQILGYSPLPQNLVQAGFTQVAKIPGAVASPSIGSCSNPAFGLLASAPQPLACQSRAATVSCDGTTPVAATPTATVTTSAGAISTAVPAATATSLGPVVAATPPGGSPVPGTSATGHGGATRPAVTSGAAAPVTSGPVPSAGMVPKPGAPVAAQTNLVDQAGAPYVTSVSLAARSESNQTTMLYWLSAVVLLAVVVAPPLIS